MLMFPSCMDARSLCFPSCGHGEDSVSPGMSSVLESSGHSRVAKSP